MKGEQKMEYGDWVRQGLEGEAALKLILCGSVEKAENGKVGVVAVVYATEDKSLAKKKLEELTAAYPDNYYMVYSVPLDTDLTALGHYPPIEISMGDLQ